MTIPRSCRASCTAILFGALVGCSALGLPASDPQSPVRGGNDLGETSPVDLGGSPSSDLAGGGAGDGGGPGVGELFDTPAPFMLPASVTDGHAVAVGDVNGDGRADVVVAAATSDPLNGVVIVVPQTATGTLGMPISYSLGQPSIISGGTIGIADLDGDGRLDVAVAGNQGVAVLRQNAAGALAPAEMLIGSSDNRPNLIVTVDVDLDGRADIVAGGTYCNGIDVWKQTAQGTLSAVEHSNCPSSGYDDLAVGDLNGDHRPDVGLMVGAQVCLLLSGANGYATYTTLPLDGMAAAIAAGDVNHDGRDDLVITGGGNRPSSYLHWYPQNGQGALDPPLSMASLDLPGEVQLADVDGDGRSDALVLHDGFFAMGVYLQVAAGGFAAEGTFYFPPTTRFTVGDVNGDGRPDIVAVSASNELMVAYHR